MRLDINLASRPYEDTRRFWVQWGGVVAGLGLLTLLLLFSLASGLYYSSKDRQTIRKLQSEIAERDAERAKAEAFLNRPENRSTRDRSLFLNELIQRKAFSWTKVFEDLERVMPARLHVVSIRPQLNDENQLAIKMQVAGDSRERALDLVRRMEASSHFVSPRIDVENSASQSSTGDQVTVEVTAVYIPNRPGQGQP